MYKSRRAPKQRQDARKPSFRTRCVRLRRPADVPPPPSQRPVAPRRSQRLRKDSAANGEDLSSRLRLALRESVAEVFEEAAAIDWLFRTGKTAKMGSVERKRAEGVEGGRFEPIPPEKWVYRTPDKGQSLPKVGKSGESKMIPVLLRTTNRCKTLYQLDEQEGFRKVLRGDGINIGNARRIASFVTSRDESDAMRVQVSPLLNTMYEEVSVSCFQFVTGTNKQMKYLLFWHKRTVLCRGTTTKTIDHCCFDHPQSHTQCCLSVTIDIINTILSATKNKGSMLHHHHQQSNCFVSPKNSCTLFYPSPANKFTITIVITIVSKETNEELYFCRPPANKRSVLNHHHRQTIKLFCVTKKTHHRQTNSSPSALLVA